uniref:NADH-ubiquinone oxidoreductase chain 6 n=1 Tax=Psephenidae sp. BMNH 842687 TaxID=1903804 RepID=A0A343A4A2_9COLE|nr:NADH dehydrogenase subunit 6 [Psephenidae sp. BMNH 842687]
MLFFIMMNSMILNIIFINLNHPISLGFILLIQTLLIAMMSSFLTYSFWLSYILFLIMVGGMLILFTYVTSIASNETFMFSNKLIMFISFTMLASMIIFLFFDKTFIYQMLKNSDMMDMMNKINFMSENSIILNKIYNKPNNLISTLLINYLFLTLIIVVKITNIKYGPLRQKF